MQELCFLYTYIEISTFIHVFVLAIISKEACLHFCLHASSIFIQKLLLCNSPFAVYGQKLMPLLRMATAMMNPSAIMFPSMEVPP